jgi:dethiobiotin synthetase
MSAAFITGTGTDVGKTFVTAGLIRCFRALGQPIDALKPLVSGFDLAAPSGSDPAILLDALGRGIEPEALQAISPWHFRAPLSPDMAARAEDRAIDFEEAVTFCRVAAEKTAGTLLIEGIGGVMVPLDRSHTVLDLMARLGFPAILVTGSYLGALSHIFCAQEVILRRALDLRAIVVSETERSSVPLEETLATLANFAKAPVLCLRRHMAGASNAAVFRHLAELIS